jgi:hypothetical protein
MIPPGVVVEGTQDGVAGRPGHVEEWDELGRLGGPENFRGHPLQLVHLGPPAHGAQGAVGMGEGEVPPRENITLKFNSAARCW